MKKCVVCGEIVEDGVEVCPVCHAKKFEPVSADAKSLPVFSLYEKSRRIVRLLFLSFRKKLFAEISLQKTQYGLSVHYGCDNCCACRQQRCGCNSCGNTRNGCGCHQIMPAPLAALSAECFI